MNADLSANIKRCALAPSYLIYSNGQVWSEKSSRFLKPSPSGKRGYLAVSLRHEDTTLRAYVHTLVADAFIGPRPAGYDVCHNDGTVTNNAYYNLRYASRADNLSDREAHGTAQRGERNPAATLTDEEAAEIRRRRRSGENLRPLADYFGVRESTISRIANGVRRAA